AKSPAPLTGIFVVRSGGSYRAAKVTVFGAERCAAGSACCGTGALSAEAPPTGRTGAAHAASRLLTVASTSSVRCAGSPTPDERQRMIRSASGNGRAGLDQRPILLAQLLPALRRLQGPLHRLRLDLHERRPIRTLVGVAGGIRRQLAGVILR